MDSTRKELVCDICKKGFSSVSTKNRHIRNFHPSEKPVENKSHILCPLCPDTQKFLSINALTTHITDAHEISIKKTCISFRNLEEFDKWKNLENRNVDYASFTTAKASNGDEYKYYNCNRSNSKEYETKCKERNCKSGGSIKIKGICPSRIVVKISPNGVIAVTYYETHVGHEDELRSKHLTKLEQSIIVEKLIAGVTTERIIQDARIVKNNKLERYNLITRSDIAYLSRKFNINKQRDADDGEKDTKKIIFIDKTNAVNSSTPTRFEELREIILQEYFKKVYAHATSLNEKEFYKFMAERQFNQNNPLI